MNTDIEIPTNGLQDKSLSISQSDSLDQLSSSDTNSPDESLSSIDDGTPVLGTIGISPGVEMVKKISGIPETASMEVLIDDGEDCLIEEENGSGQVEEIYASSDSSGTLSINEEANLEEDSSDPKEAVNMDLVLVALNEEENSGEDFKNSLRETPSMEVLVDLDEPALDEELEKLSVTSTNENQTETENEIEKNVNEDMTEKSYNQKLKIEPYQEGTNSLVTEDEFGEVKIEKDDSNNNEDTKTNTLESFPGDNHGSKEDPMKAKEPVVEKVSDSLEKTSEPTIAVTFSEPLDIRSEMRILGSTPKSTPTASMLGSVPTILEDQPLSLEVCHAPKFGDDEDDEYFEEFHLPNTHENAFVRHQSFRRKVKLTPINAPDAEHIEGLVRTGDLNRQGSIRRKILPEEDEDECSYSSSLSSLSDRLNQDIQEIETIIHDEEKKALDAEKEGIQKRPMAPQDTDRSLLFEDTYPHITEIPEDPHDSLMFGTLTLKKIQKCMNASSHKSIYHLSGRLQDILTPIEIEEVLNNSHLYSPFLTAEVLEALSMSLNDQIEDTVARSKKNTPPNGEILQKLADSQFASSKEDDEVNPLSSTYSSLKVIPAPKLNLSQDEDSETTGLSTTLGSENFEGLTFSTDSSTPNISSPDRASDANSVFYRQNQKNTPAKSERSGHIEINTIAPMDRADPQLVSQLDNIPPPPPDLIQELNDGEEMQSERHWRNVVINGAWRRIDMKAIAPYKMSISHGGNTDDGQCSIIMISSCLLPDKSKKDYNYVMDNLFMYALSYLETLVSEDYILIYLAGGTSTNGPNFHWMRKTYSMLDRNIRKNLKQLLIVHPSLWSKTLIVLSRPFVSSKFYRKLVFVNSLTELAQLVPLAQLEIPDLVQQLDFQLMIKQKKKKNAYTKQ